jgi:nucleoside-diphosphate-sugar epimerase
MLKELLKNDIFVYVLVRKKSKRRERVDGLSGVKIIEMDMDDIRELPQYIRDIDVFYHLAWEGERNNFTMQMKNIEWAVNAMKVAHNIGAKQFICTGSQAEYGIFKHKVDEKSPTNPNTAYGACKLACYNLLKTLAMQLKLPFTWVRVFSVYGEGDNPNTLISYLFKCFKENEIPKLSSGNQLWDFLYAEDATNALYLLAKENKTGLYNLAFGESRPLKEFIIEMKDLINPEITLDFNYIYPKSNVELIANVNKIKTELEWEPKFNFVNGILTMKKLHNL